MLSDGRSSGRLAVFAYYIKKKLAFHLLFDWFCLRMEEKSERKEEYL